MIDVTWLMHMPAARVRDTNTSVRYEIRTVQLDELDQLIREKKINQQVGNYRELEKSGRNLVAAYCEGRIVSFAWLARHSVAGPDNFSRAMHLGTSVDLPEGSAFVYNVWTDPDHRGKRLVGALLRWAINHQVAGDWSLATMIDWTNIASIRAFEKTGMRRLGIIVRIGRGPLQFSLVPAAAKKAGLQLATDAPGLKLAL